MGRPRKKRLDLPQRVYFKHGAYYFVDATGRYHHLGRALSEALQGYAKLVGSDQVQCPKNFGDVIEYYMQMVLPNLKPSTQKDYQYILGNLRTAFGHINPADIEEADIYRYMFRRGNTPRVNREVSVLSSLFRLAKKCGIRCKNPCLDLERVGEHERERCPSASELEAFKQVCIEHFCDRQTALYVDLKRMTGLRANNMIAIRRDMISAEGLAPGTSKKGRKQLFLFRNAAGQSTGLKELLDEIFALKRRVRSLYLFCRKDGQPYTVEGFQANWQRRMNKFVKSGGERFWEHDIRATAATEADEAGEDANALLGHKQKSTTERYLRSKKMLKIGLTRKMGDSGQN